MVGELGYIVVVGVGDRSGHPSHTGRCRCHPGRTTLASLSVVAQRSYPCLQLLFLVTLLDGAQDICDGKRCSVLRTEGHSIYRGPIRLLTHEAFKKGLSVSVLEYSQRLVNLSPRISWRCGFVPSCAPTNSLNGGRAGEGRGEDKEEDEEKQEIWIPVRILRMRRRRSRWRRSWCVGA